MKFADKENRGPLLWREHNSGCKLYPPSAKSYICPIIQSSNPSLLDDTECQFGLADAGVSKYSINFDTSIFFETSVAKLSTKKHKHFTGGEDPSSNHGVRNPYSMARHVLSENLLILILHQRLIDRSVGCDV